MKVRVICGFAAVLLSAALLWQCGDGVTDLGEGGGGDGQTGGDGGIPGESDGGGGKDAGRPDAGGDAGKDAGPQDDAGGGDGSVDDASVEDAGPSDGSVDDGSTDDGGEVDGGCAGFIECLEDLGGGCCGDVAVQPVCNNGQFECSQGSIPSSQCQGIGPGCFIPDGGTTDGGDDAGSLCELGGGYCVFFQDNCKSGFHDGPGLGCPGGKSGKCCLPGEPDAGPGDDGGVTGDGAIDGSVTDGGETDGGVSDGGTADGGTVLCKPGDTRDYECPDHHFVPWCVCTPGACQPECQAVGSFSEGWYDPCSGQLIRYALCSQCASECREIGSKSEGWYDTCGSLLIIYAACAPSWTCKDHPETQCVAQIPCVGNCDCPPDRPLCRNSFCGDASILECMGDDTLCPCGQYCDGVGCVAGTKKCSNACDCAQGEICVNEVCRAKLDPSCVDEPCPCGQICRDIGPLNQCVAGCTNNCDCPDATPICIGGACGKLPGSGCGNDSRNCPCGQVCVNNLCEDAASACSTNCDCKDPKSPICRNGACAAQAARCTLDADCPCGQECGSNGCADIPPPCQTSCDCGLTEICEAGVCTPQLPGRCQDDNDCLCGQTCGSLGRCEAGGQPCQRSCDCPQGLVCTNNKCVNPLPGSWCQTDAECPCQTYCAGGFCAQGCNDGCDCPDTSPFCVNRKCTGVVVGLCKADADCRCAEVCNNGACEPSTGACNTSCDCPQGLPIDYVCKNGMCVQYTTDFCLYKNDCPCSFNCTNNKCTPI
ncbi:MAG: hypothetical protein HY897_01750 [Deltaproteobacteria bacterium]|nr:hypothetical protein [Deltaproteobacteria bacterium]